MKATILQHARKIDDRIQLARASLKSGPNTTTETVEFLLSAATEAYFDLNEAAHNLPDDSMPTASKRGEGTGKGGRDDDREANLEGLAFDASITVPRAWDLLDLAHEHLKAGKTNAAVTLVLSARETISSLYTWLNALKEGDEA